MKKNASRIVHNVLNLTAFGLLCFIRMMIFLHLKELFPDEDDKTIQNALSTSGRDMNVAANVLAGIEDGKFYIQFVSI